MIIYSVSSKRRRVLSIGDVQASLFVWWDGRHLKGNLWTNVWLRAMSPGRGRIRRNERRSHVHGLLRKCPTARQFQMFRFAWLRDTYSRSGNGKDQSMLQTSGQISGSHISLH